MSEEKQVKCPHCQEIFGVPMEAPTAEEIAQVITQERDNIEELLKKYQVQLPRAEDHRHKTADEFLDCEGCSKWFNETATKYTITAKEQPPPETEKEPEPKATPVGSIFQQEGESSEQ